jgi:hypothetical protein
MTFLYTSNGFVNLGLVTRLHLGRQSGPGAPVPVSIDMVDGSAVHAEASRTELDRALAPSDVVIPAQPGYRRLTWFCEDMVHHVDEVIAWCIRDGVADPVCTSEQEPQTRVAIHCPDGSVLADSATYSDVRAWRVACAVQDADVAA